MASKEEGVSTESVDWFLSVDGHLHVVWHCRR